MKRYAQAMGIWCLIIPLAILNGGLRENILNKMMGNIALPVSGIILSVCVFFIAYFFIPRIKQCKNRDYIFFGIMWFALTNLFDLLMYLNEGGGISDLAKSYDFTTGNLWILVVLSAAFAPMLVMKRKR